MVSSQNIAPLKIYQACFKHFHVHELIRRHTVRHAIQRRHDCQWWNFKHAFMKNFRYENALCNYCSSTQLRAYIKVNMLQQISYCIKLVRLKGKITRKKRWVISTYQISIAHFRRSSRSRQAWSWCIRVQPRTPSCECSRPTD